MLSTARIELVARRALDDRESARRALAWYRTAQEWARSMADRYSLPLASVVGAVAALSPQQSWEEQLTYTPLVLEAFRQGRALPGPGFKANKAKAWRILSGERPADVLSGAKVRAFFSCIMVATDYYMPHENVCIDRHAWAIAAGMEAAGLSLTDKRYRETAEAYRSAAGALRLAFPELAHELTPAGVQALTWVWWRANEGARF